MDTQQELTLMLHSFFCKPHVFPLNSRTFKIGHTVIIVRLVSGKIYKSLALK